MLYKKLFSTTRKRCLRRFLHTSHQVQFRYTFYPVVLLPEPLCRSPKICLSIVGTFKDGTPLRDPLPDVLVWIETPGENIHRLRHHESDDPVLLRVDPKQDR